MIHKYKLNQAGSALISLIIVVPFLILITTLYMELAVSSLQVAKKDQYQTYSQFTADAGIDYAMKQISTNPAWTGTAGQVELQNENGIRTTYQLTVTTVGTTSKTITAVGRVFRPATSTTPASTKTVHADLRPVQSGTYSVVTGVGGLYMSNSSKIVGGDVLVNGEIVMSNTAQIGLSTNPVDVQVAHMNCPSPANTTYPRLCASGENGQPITITNTAHIYGTVKANNQTNGNSMSNPGLTSGTVTPGTMPTHDRAAQEAAVANNQTGATAGCSGSTNKTWPANLKITGDVNISGSCKVTVSGNVWITGKLDMGNSSQLIISNSLSVMPDIMVDGATVKLNNSSSIVSNSTGYGARILTYHSSASCSPGCANVTGTDLYNSRAIETITLSNSTTAPASVFYARWTKVKMSNSGGVGALVGQTVDLTNSASVTFASNASVIGETFWVLDGYRRGN